MVLSRVLSPTMVGRDSELSTLEDALLRALRGDGGVVIVGGEAGMGKTRLVGALAGRARRLGCAVMSGACSEAELSLPYLPFLEAIGNFLPSIDIAALRERLGTAAEELAHLFPQLGRAATTVGDEAQAKMRLFESILILLRDAASARALLVILEDLQWADPATRELLDYSTRRLRSTNVLIVATYRTDEMHRKHALLPTVQGWRRNGQVEMVELAPLSAGQVAEMVCAIFEETSITDEFRDFLRERSEGNPFVLEEMLRDALDRGEIFRTDTGWDRKTLAEFRIPATVRDTILQRITRLSDADVAVLSAASVMGRSFDLQSLAAVAGVDQAAAMSSLEASVTAQLVEQEDRTSARYRFRHALTREAIYDDLVFPRRQQLHARVADVLASQPDHRPVDVAHHLLLAGRNDEAVAMCVAAAEDAVRRYAYRDAAELLERAAPFVRDVAARGRMLCRAAECYWDNTESLNAKRMLEQGIADLEGCGLTDEAARNRLLLGRCHWELMRTDLAREEFEKVRVALEPSGPSEALALAYMRLGSLADWNGEYKSGRVLIERAVELADAAGADLVQAWSLNFLAGAEIGAGEIEAAYQHYEESYTRSVRHDYRFQIANAVYNATWTASHMALGEKLAVWSGRIDTVPIADTTPWPWYMRALVGLQRGEVAEAITQSRAAVQRSRDVGHQKMLWRSQVQLAHSLAEAMKVAEAVEVLPPLASRVDTQDEIYDTGPRIRVAVAAGGIEEAFTAARSFIGKMTPYIAPIDVVSEVASDPAWFRAHLESVPVTAETASCPRLAVARGRLALLEGRVHDALEGLRAGEAGLRAGGFLLDAWYVGGTLAIAEARSGDGAAAERRLSAIAAEAAQHGALLAAASARQAAAELGFVVAEPAPRRDEEAAARIATGERMVSVLFADVRGYTTMTGKTAPADLADRIGALQRWARQEVERRSGVVDKFAGDATMATFNVSGQSVDHAVQAVRAAVAIIDKAGLAGLPVGAGVAVGAAVVGNLAEGSNLSVLGEVTNLASRLQAQAGAGEVLLSDEAFRRARSWLEAHGLEADPIAVDLKGFPPGLAAYRIVSEVAAAAAV